MSWKYSEDVLHRKLAYLASLADPNAIFTIGDKLINQLKDTQLEISYEAVWRTLEQLYLTLNLTIDWSQMDFPWLPEDWNFPDDLGDLTNPPSEQTQKAYYDVSYYDLSYYDPPEVVYKDIERFAWNTRYKVSEKHTLEYKKMSVSLKKLIESLKDSLKKTDVADFIPDVVESTLAMVEGRILRGSYVGFSIVGLTRVSKRHEPWMKYRAPCPTRYPKDWKTIIETESVLAWESVVGFSHVGYARVGAWYMFLNKAISDAMIQRINEFWTRTGLVEAGELSPYGGIAYYRYPPEKIKTLWQRIFMLQRMDQYHFEGGKHQLKMQYDIKRIRQLLDQHGVISPLKGAYISFANELKYLEHDSHRLHKRWKKLITEEDIIDKYKRMGLDENILEEIRRLIKP